MKFLPIAIALTLLPIPVVAQSKPPSDTISGQLKLIAGGIDGRNDNCYGTGKFRDLTGLMPVIIKDEQGKIIATGSTGFGKRPTEHPTVICIFSFRIQDVPESKFYSIAISDRGTAIFSRQELIDMNWEAKFVLTPSR